MARTVIRLISFCPWPKPSSAVFTKKQLAFPEYSLGTAHTDCGGWDRLTLIAHVAVTAAQVLSGFNLLVVLCGKGWLHSPWSTTFQLAWLPTSIDPSICDFYEIHLLTMSASGARTLSGHEVIFHLGKRPVPFTLRVSRL